MKVKRLSTPFSPYKVEITIESAAEVENLRSVAHHLHSTIYQSEKRASVSRLLYDIASENPNKE